MDTSSSEPAPTTKRRKIDWNGIIIKELRKVFKNAHMKPLKKISHNGKEENAPWREWFAAAMDRGVHTQLPPDIQRKALDRFYVPPQGARSQYMEPILDEITGPKGYTEMLNEAILPYSAPPTALGYLKDPPSYPIPHHELYPPQPYILSHIAQHEYLHPDSHLSAASSTIPSIRYSYYPAPYPPFHTSDPDIPYTPESPQSPESPELPQSPELPILPPMQLSVQIPSQNSTKQIIHQSPTQISSLTQIAPPTTLIQAPPTLIQPPSTLMQPPAPVQHPASVQLSSPRTLAPIQSSVPTQPLKSEEAQECTESPSPLLYHSDSMKDFFDSLSKEKQPVPLPPLPPLNSIPPEQKTSNPFLPGFFPVPRTPSSHPPPPPLASPTVRSRSSSNASWPTDSMDLSFVISLQDSTSSNSSIPAIPPFSADSTSSNSKESIASSSNSRPNRSASLSSAKEEPMESEDFAKPPKPEVLLEINKGDNVKESKSPSPHPDLFANTIKAEKVEADTVHANTVYAPDVVFTHSRQLSDVRLKEEVAPFSGGMDIVRKLEPRTFYWKENALEMAVNMQPDSPTTKSITKANTKANTNIQASEHHPNNNSDNNNSNSNINNNNNSNNNGNNSKSNTKHVNYSDPADPSHNTRQSHPSPPAIVRTASVPARLHPSIPPAAPLRASSELHLYHPNYRFYTYRDEEEKYSDYEVSDDSDSDDDMDDDYDDDLPPNKTIGFIAQEVQSACPNLVQENPTTSVLSIDTVGVLACVVEAVKDLDIRMKEVANSFSLAPSNPVSPTPPPILRRPITLPGVISLCSLEKGVIVLNPKALDFLRTLNNISILSICGSRRTAKSFLCNMFLPRDSTSKFSTISSTADGTKGLWIYTSPITDSKNEKSYIIVDSQGIDSLDPKIGKLISLLWLISSVLVYRDSRNLDIQKFDVFRSVRDLVQKIASGHEPPALAAVIDRDLKISDPDQYINSFVSDSRFPAICEAVRKCFIYRTIMQLAVPQQYQLENKDYYSGQFYYSFLSVKEKLESWLLNFKIGDQDASGPQFANYLLECVHKLNDL